MSRWRRPNQEDQQIGLTLACNIWELDARNPRWHIAAGPPHRTAFRTLGFDQPAACSASVILRRIGVDDVRRIDRAVFAPIGHDVLAAETGKARRIGVKDFLRDIFAGGWRGQTCGRE
ncbi:MAG: hypothetical protein R3C16_09345 [Hyphomonadaceae bacterium]